MTTLRKVWAIAIASGEYSDYRVLAVTDDEATAEAWAAALRSERDGYNTDARVEEVIAIPSGAPPSKIHHVRLIAELRDDGSHCGPSFDESDKYPIVSWVPPTRPQHRFVRAPMHGGRGGRLEIHGRTRASVMKVYSEQLAAWKSSPKTYGHELGESK